MRRGSWNPAPARPLTLLGGPGEGGGQLGAGAEAALAEHGGQVVLDRLGAEEQGGGDLAVGQPAATSSATRVSWEVNGSEASGPRGRAVAPVAASLSAARWVQAVRSMAAKASRAARSCSRAATRRPAPRQPGPVQQPGPSGLEGIPGLIAPRRVGGQGR
jgi:hypothetical protein